MTAADQRAIDAEQIKQAYRDAEAALSHVSRLLRSTEAGRYMWSAEHKTAISGLKVVVGMLRKDVPDYGRREDT